MSEITVKRVGKKLPNILKSLRGLNNAKVEVGHFAVQGFHHSGFTYPELMAIHHRGSNPDGSSPVVPRPLLDILWAKYRHLNDRGLKAAFTRFNKRPPSGASNKKLLDDIGKRIAKLEKGMFGDPSSLPVTNNPSPLVQIGDLKNAVSYRDSKNKALRKP